MLIKNLKTVIFDMDGLLVNSEKVYSEGWLAGIEKMKVDVPIDIIHQMTGQSASQNIALLNSHINDMAVVKEIRKVRVEYFLEKLHVGEVQLMPYAKELLEALYESPFKTVLATSCETEYATQILEQHGLHKFFHHKIYGDMVENVKPAPDIYLRALHLSEAKAEEAVMLEDSLTGAKAGENAGVNVLLIPDKNQIDVSKIENTKIINVLNHLGETFHYFFA